MQNKGFTFLALLLLLCTSGRAQKTAPAGWNEVIISLPVLGEVAHKTTRQIGASPWSVGGETMDRDYTIYQNWKDYVEELGIKKIRLQSGWAKTEKKKGEYDFAWLDEIVYDLKEKGVDPWISISYGNQIYRGGGGQLLGARLPSAGAAYRGWQNYTRALVMHYRDVVDTWEIWNEPNNHWKPEKEGEQNTPEEYAELFVTTAKIIREIQPEGTIIGVASAGIALAFNGKVLRYLKEKEATEYLDLLCYHPYSFNPDAVYPAVASLQDSIDKYAPHVKLFQGENGAPSEYRETKALRHYNWTELSQAKWFLRRALGDYGHGINTNLFSMVDLKYPDEINRKGLLLIDDDKRVLRPKHAYHAVRNMVNILKEDMQPVFDVEIADDTYHGLARYTFAGKAGKVTAIWFSDNTPADFNGTTPVDLTFPAGTFKDPVFVDLRTGLVYQIPADRRREEGGRQYFYDLPVYDSPVLIAEAAAVPRGK